MSESVKDESIKVAYQGEPGAFSDLAAGALLRARAGP
jgi:hypothetical protein